MTVTDKDREAAAKLVDRYLHGAPHLQCAAEAIATARAEAYEHAAKIIEDQGPLFGTLGEAASVIRALAADPAAERAG